MLVAFLISFTLIIIIGVGPSDIYKYLSAWSKFILPCKEQQPAIEQKPDYAAIDRMEYDMDICGVATDKRERDEQQRLKSIADAKAKMEEWDAEGVEYNCITNGLGDIVAVTPIFSPGGYQPGTAYEKYDEYGLLQSGGNNWSHTYARNATHKKQELINGEINSKSRMLENLPMQAQRYDETDFGSAYINPGDIVATDLSSTWKTYKSQ